MATVSLRLSPRPAHVRTARLVASAMARRSGVDEGLLDDVRLAVGEACARAVRLHERNSVHAPISVELSDGIEFTVVVTDASGQYPDAAGPPAEDWTADGQEDESDALGLAVLESVVDVLRVEKRNGGGTQVTMRWPVAQALR